jgi:hypothetical protein
VKKDYTIQFWRNKGHFIQFDIKDAVRLSTITLMKTKVHPFETNPKTVNRVNTPAGDGGVQAEPFVVVLISSCVPLPGELWRAKVFLRHRVLWAEK